MEKMIVVSWYDHTEGEINTRVVKADNWRDAALKTELAFDDCSEDWILGMPEDEEEAKECFSDGEISVNFTVIEL